MSSISSLLPSRSRTRTTPALRTDKQQQITEAAIAERAFLKFLDRGEEPGSDVQDWLLAEQELEAEAQS